MLPAKSSGTRPVTDTAAFAIHPQLLDDCHYLGKMDRCHLLLHNNASIFWLILVPETEVTELHDMDAQQYQYCMMQVRELANFAKCFSQADKVNVAAIGNIVPQLHVHIIARRKDDPCWPGVVWGNLDNTSRYSEHQMNGLRTTLTEKLSLMCS